ncbi:MAG: hypothetical protein H7832_10530 [Magnetococcus sp. DMHC-6]
MIANTSLLISTAQKVEDLLFAFSESESEVVRQVLWPHLVESVEMMIQYIRGDMGIFDTDSKSFDS